MKPVIFAAALAAALAAAAGPAQAERVCVEEAAGVCLKYRDARPAPSPPGAAEEARLGMGPVERKAVQRGLAAAGVYSGGIDGALGPRSRRAIAVWQRGRGEAATGYLTAGQVAALAAAAPASSAPASAAGAAAPRGGDWTAELDMERSVHCRDLRLRSFKVSGGSMTMVIFHPLDGASRFSGAIGGDGSISARAQSNFCSSRLDGRFSGGAGKGTVRFECTETACRGEWSAAAR